MHSTNNYDSEQNYIYCRNDCGAEITFRNNAISKYGKKIPIQENGLPHNCPNSYFHKKRRELQESNNRFGKEFKNTGHLASVDCQERCPDLSPRQEHIPDSPNHKITQEHQGHANVEIPSEVQEFLSTSSGRFIEKDE